MLFVTRSKLAGAAAERWHKLYSSRQYWHSKIPSGSQSYHGVWEALVELGPDPEPDAVDSVIGNPSWTKITCDNCTAQVFSGVALGSHSDDEYGPCHYCLPCLESAANAFKE